MYIQEIFPSFQGEGILVGVPQVFLRLSDCNLQCTYCDTPEARERGQSFLVEDREGRVEGVPNPVEVPEVASLISSVWDPAFHSVSVTGGEPLLQAGELAELFPRLKEQGRGIYLETNGTLHEQLVGLIPWIDYIAMDVKLPSTQGGVDLLDQHLLFLRRALAGNVFLKMVVDARTEDGEVERACRLLGQEACEVTLVLQPATALRGEEDISPRRVAELYRTAVVFFGDVRVIPQMHRNWGAR